MKVQWSSMIKKQCSSAWVGQLLMVIGVIWDGGRSGLIC